MSFDTIRNHQERLVLAAVRRIAVDFPGLATRSELLADVACVALNRLPPRYIRFETDHSFYQPDPERLEEERRAEAAVREAIQFVRERALAGART